MNGKNVSIVIMLSAAIVIVVAGTIGGTGFATDEFLIHRLMTFSDNVVWVKPFAVALAYMGGTVLLIPIAIVCIAYLAWRKRWHDMAMFVTITLGGRLLIEILKLLVGRQRPHFEPYAVQVSSLSFPSGHAGNTMLTYLAVATIIVAQRWRRPAIAVAVAASLVVGLSRPILGVHWPSDVLAGWMLGIGITIGCLTLFRREGSAA